MMIRKAVMMTLIAFSLQSCATIEIAHSPLKITQPCVPVHGVIFNIGETDVMSDQLYAKFKKIIVTYKQRLITNCDNVIKHNKAHE